MRWKVAYGRSDPKMDIKHAQGVALLEKYRRGEVPDFSGDDWMTPKYLSWVVEREGYVPAPKG